MEASCNVVALTGAGVSVASGIPDYRSVKGVYQGLEQPEYLLSRTCFEQEPHKFYQFVKNLYHSEAKANIIHHELQDLIMAKGTGGIITQNIDQLHGQYGSAEVVEFHGSLYRCYCTKCRRFIDSCDYLVSAYHPNCGGIIRPDIVLYEEGLDDLVVNRSKELINQADLILIVGTSFKVFPFCQLLNFKNELSDVIVINDRSIMIDVPHEMVIGKAESFFEEMNEWRMKNNAKKPTR
ncbi:NAD-dependent protein deacylase [Vagococcus coleopterorum]|uniref:protein acetyllysine N-acetyltransferase n=2 Tax=Vagococcus coleopterorum TaxID=2714946 RepID=A0A6G8APY4_9ENTE|nr:NAD-dependent protein deacylase [Vagococcus coleopterorum]